MSLQLQTSSNEPSPLPTGFESLPELYGSKPRHPPPKVDDFQSGVKAAGMGLFHGYYDAITGLVTEPIEGGKKEVSCHMPDLANYALADNTTR